MYPGCLYLRSLSMGKSYSVTRGTIERFFEKPALKIPIYPHAAARHSRRRRLAWIYRRGSAGTPKRLTQTGSRPAHASNTYVPRIEGQLHTLSHSPWIGPRRLPDGT